MAEAAVATLDPLEFYARHGAALFPIPAGQKAPFGIVGSFKHDSSRDPEQWAFGGWASGFQLAHADRLDHGRGIGQLADE